jgi:hypothetical protein
MPPKSSLSPAARVDAQRILDAEARRMWAERLEAEAKQPAKQPKPAKIGKRRAT